jgi:hypothetical protein
MALDVFKIVCSKKINCYTLLTFLAAVTTLVAFYWFQPQPEECLVGFACDREGCFMVAVDETGVMEPHFALREKEVDLTGDGLPEKVVFEDNSLAIFKDGIRVWQSPPSWIVVDYALGDPNDDGRSEILVALWKPDADGILRSHPFIVGFRGGRYKTIWGGSAVTYGIQELLLADLDGDSRQELIVLESADMQAGPVATLRTLSVWDWHGWGFNLRWRSETGRYSNLTLVTAEDGDRPQMFVRQCN